MSEFLKKFLIISKVCEKFEIDFNEKNIDQYLTNLELIYQVSSSQDLLKYSNIIKYISSNFYSIDKSKIISLPLGVLYSIISHPNLKIESEDSLFEFITKLFKDKEEEVGCKVIDMTPKL